MDSNDIISLITAAYKDKVERKTFDDLRVGMNELLAADVASRREKAAADIIQMANFNIALKKFEVTYYKIKEEYGTVNAIEDYITDIRRRIKVLSYKKNHGILN